MTIGKMPAAAPAAPTPPVTFPHSDPYWTAALNAVRRLLRARDFERALVPLELTDKLGPIAVPAIASYLRPPSKGDLVLLHKGQLEQWSLEALGRLRGFRCLWANPVFALYAQAPARFGLLRLQSWLTRVHRPDAQAFAVPDRAARPSGEARHPTVLLISAGGMGNLGDDAVTACAANIIGASHPNLRIERCGPPVTREDIIRSDCVVLGGGGLLYDRCFRNLQNYALPLLMGAELGRPSVCLGIGTQGIRTDMGRRLLGKALGHSRWVSVRDPIDAQIVREIAPQARVSVDRDLAFSLGRPSPAPSAGNRTGKRVGMAWRCWQRVPAAWREPYRQTIHHAFEALPPGTSVELLLQSREDLPFYRTLQSRFGCTVQTFDGWSLQQVLSHYAEMDLVLGSRYHGLIFSLLAARPIISIGGSAGKIGRLVGEILPSARRGHIPLHRCTPHALDERLALFARDPSALTPAWSEVNACIERVCELKTRLAEECPL